MHILLVEDDPEIARLLTDVLTGNGFETSSATRAAEMEDVFARRVVDLVILDAMLPDEDGFSICRRLRAASNIPIVMLTALADDIDRIVGIEIGADDYITKPFNSRELVARIRGLLRRARGTGQAENRLRSLGFKGWKLDPVARQLYDPEGVQVTMTSAEFDLLHAFCRHPGRVLSRDELLDLTPGGQAGPIARSIDVHVSRVRQKIEPDPQQPTLIKTVRLSGYIFTATVGSV
ncbi:MAG TPA: response regulator transcription factor [Alphaproteobacteria bacterium]|nr:response regulator transcription factor [Alphaproteobacteria bacterium]